MPGEHRASTWNSVTSKCEGVPTPARIVCDVAAGAVYVESKFDHPLDHILYLFIGGVGLHGNDHHF